MLDKMKSIDDKNKFIELSESYFKDQAYKLRKSDTEYILQRKDIINIFRLNIIPKSGWYILKTEVYFCYKKINKLNKTIHNSETSISGVTSVFGIRDEYPERGNYSIETYNDIENCIKDIFKDFEEVAKPFYESINTIEDIDSYYNQRETVFGSQYTSSDAVIASYLNGTDYKVLAQKYYDFWYQSQRDLATVILETRDHLSKRKKA